MATPSPDEEFVTPTAAVAARLEALAPANVVVISAVTARLVRGALGVG